MANRYPSPKYSMPSKDEIETALKLSHQVYSEVYEIINEK
jgi:hypothetical protein